MQVRFVADDTAPGSMVEAAVDDVFLNVVRDRSTPVEDPLLLPARLVLGENYPNPFNPKTTVRFDLPQAGRVELAVFDLGGRKVATLVNDQLARRPPRRHLARPGRHRPSRRERHLRLPAAGRRRGADAQDDAGEVI